MWILYALIASALWGIVYVLDEKLFHYISPPQLMFILGAFGMVVWGLYLFGTGQGSGLQELNAGGRAAWILMALTVVVYFGASLMIYNSIKGSNASLAALVEISYPIFTCLFAWLVYREVQLTPLSMVGAAVIITGVVLVFLGSRGKDEDSAQAFFHEVAGKPNMTLLHGELRDPLAQIVSGYASPALDDSVKLPKRKA